MEAFCIKREKETSVPGIGNEALNCLEIQSRISSSIFFWVKHFIQVAVLENL